MIISVKELNLNDLVALDALLAERHVTRAAARLHLTQSAMSHALKRLRSVLGDELLVRGAAGLTPTARGQRLARAVHRALEEIDGALRDEHSFVAEKAQRAFRVACVDMAAAPLLVPLARSLPERAPGVSVALQPVDPDHIVEQLERGELDAAVLGPEPTPGMLRRRVALDSSVCVLRRGHPALRRWSAKEFSRWPHVAIELPGLPPRFIDDTLEAHGCVRHVRLRLPYFGPAVFVAASSDFIFLAPGSIARRMARYLPLALRPVPAPLPTFDWNLVWHPRADADPANLWLREALADALARPPEDVLVRRGGTRARIARKSQRGRA